jgi:transposase-like protein
MPITPSNPFKGRHFPGEVILLCVRWYLRYPPPTNMSLNSWRNAAWR